jgi:hypothetical protein
MGELIQFPKRRPDEVDLPLWQIEEALGVSRRTLERYIAEGMDSRLVSGRRRVKLSVAREWKARRREAG